MKKTLLTLSMMLALGLSAGFAAAPAFADDSAELMAASAGGTIETAAVTGPITVGSITYIPCGGSCAGSAATDSSKPTGGASGNALYLGTVQTLAVTGPITIGDITYIPGR